MKYGLWNLETGLMLLPLIQHCMPPPSIKELKNLIGSLITHKINCDWAPYDILVILQKKIRHLSQLLPEEDYKHVDYPINYGINRITSVSMFSHTDKAALIIKFVETVFTKTGSAIMMKENQYYSDVYSLRDIFIHELAQKNHIILSGNTTKNIDNKKERVFALLSNERRIGESSAADNFDESFWNDAPFIGFTLVEPIKVAEKPINKKQSDSQCEELYEKASHEKAFSALSNDFQRYTIQNTHSKWIRNNVRSYADANQLCLSNIFRYFEFILSAKNDKYESIFTVCLLALAIGINKKRWANITTNPLQKLHDENVFINEANQILIYKVAGCATNFSQEKDPESQYIIVKLPESFHISYKTILKGTQEAAAIRSFLRKNNGISTGINRIARSGHNLVRKINSSESDAFLLAGAIPIEFRARNAYKAINNYFLNQIFQQNLSTILALSSKNKLEFPKTYTKLKKLLKQNLQPIKNHIVGSQLTNSSPNFVDFKLSKVNKDTFDRSIHIANQFELYFFWMLQYGFSTRPIGPSTESVCIENFWLHKDKNSEVYQEKKLLLVPPLIKAQYKQIMLCREKLRECCQKIDYQLVYPDDNHCLSFQYKRFSTKKIVQADLLCATEAQKISQQWGMKQPFARLNAHRHQCATYMHNKMSERHAEIFLGHHIDGYFFAAPESSGTIKPVIETQNAQTTWLNLLGFKYLQNPIL